MECDNTRVSRRELVKSDFPDVELSAKRGSLVAYKTLYGEGAGESIDGSVDDAVAPYTKELDKLESVLVDEGA